MVSTVLINAIPGIVWIKNSGNPQYSAIFWIGLRRLIQNLPCKLDQLELANFTGFSTKSVRIITIPLVVRELAKKQY